MSNNSSTNNNNNAKAKAAAEEIERDQQRAKVPTGESLLERATALTKDSSPDEVDAILQDAAKIELSPAWVAKILNALFEHAGTPKTALRDSWKLFRSEAKKAKKKEIKNRARGGTPKNAANFWFDSIEECMDAINKDYALVLRGEEMRVVCWDNESKPIFLRERDARMKLGQYLVFAGEEDDPPHNGFRLWLQSPERREYDRVVFNPRTLEDDEDELNLWTGFAAKEREGDWSLLRNHILENICQGDEAHFKFVLGWMAQMFQRPWEKSDVALVFRGKKGVGKTKLSWWLRKAVGLRHSLWVDSPEQWTGKFNGQLETVIFLGCEEGFFAGDPKAVSRINHIITAPLLPYERKGKDMYEGPNYTRIMMTTNAKWAVPATAGERRFFVLDVGSKHKQDKAYFAAIDAQMENGGLEAMMHDLMHHNFDDVDFVNPPMTAALADQIRAGLSPAMKWLESILTDGQLSFKDDEGDREWAKWPAAGTMDIPKNDVVASYREAVPGFRGPASPQEVGEFLHKNVPGITVTRKDAWGEKQVRHWRFPSLEDMRAAFLAANPGYAFPDEPEEQNVINMEEKRKARSSQADNDVADASPRASGGE